MTCLATFHTTSATIMFERTMRKIGIEAKIIPVPRSLSTSCGFACEFPCDKTGEVRDICSSRKIEFEAIHNIL